MKTIMGVVRPTRGSVVYQGQAIERMPTAERVRRGIAPVLEARRLFPRMTVFENLEMGAYLRKRGAEFDQDLERVYSLFPRVKERRSQIAGTLSGGEQQMVAMGRALMARPKLLCMDEPSMGLAPIFVEQVFDIIQEINSRARRSSWSSRTPTWRCRSRIGPMCCRPARWCCPAPRRSCGRTR